MKTFIGGRQVEAVIRFSSPGTSMDANELLARIGRTNLPVLITGETGTGKELLARALHLQSTIQGGPFVAIDCGALPPSLAEAELFGYRKGSFTGAVLSKAGLMSCGGGGTIFLDEIGELSLELQPKLLRVIQEREVRQLGSLNSVPIMGRIVAATNRNLEQMVHDGRFREDLYYRLSVLNLELLPLREHKEDIATTCRVILNEFEKDNSLKHAVSDDALELMCLYDWPGNIRELENCLKRIAALKPADAVIEASDLPPRVRIGAECETMSCRNDNGTLRAIEKAILLHALEASRGNKMEAAKRLGIGKTTVYRKLKEYQAEMDLKKTP